MRRVAEVHIVILGLLLLAGSSRVLGDEAAPSSPQAVGTGMSLDDAIGLALARNPDFQAAAARIGEAEAKVGEATSAFYPQVSARVGFARTDNPAQAFAMILNQGRFNSNLDFNNPGATQNVRPEVVGALPLFRGGQDWARRQASLLGVEAIREERLALRNALTAAVISTYYALVAAPEQVGAARASVEAVSAALEQARIRLDTGTALRSDVLSLEVRLAEAREGLVRADNGVELARVGMRGLLALPPETAVDIAPPTTDAAAQVPGTVAEGLVLALRQRPELVAAQRQVEMGEREVQAERAAYLPRIDAVGSFGNDSADLSVGNDRNSWAVGVAAELDVFSGFRTRERVRAAERRLEQARLAQRQVQLEVERDVQTSHLTYDEARQRRQVADAAVAAAEEALRLVQVQYDAGTVTITRYLEAEGARTAARSRAIAARYDLRRSESGLQRAIGVWARKEVVEE